MAVIDRTSEMTMTQAAGSVQQERCLMGANNVIRVNFSLNCLTSGTVHLATIPSDLAPRKNTFFTVFNHTRKNGTSGYVTIDGRVFINNSIQNDHYWVAVSYIR